MCASLFVQGLDPNADDVRVYATNAAQVRACLQPYRVHCRLSQRSCMLPQGFLTSRLCTMACIERIPSITESAALARGRCRLGGPAVPETRQGGRAQVRRLWCNTHAACMVVAEALQ